MRNFSEYIHTTTLHQVFPRGATVGELLVRTTNFNRESSVGNLSDGKYTQVPIRRTFSVRKHSAGFLPHIYFVYQKQVDYRSHSEMACVFSPTIDIKWCCAMCHKVRRRTEFVCPCVPLLLGWPNVPKVELEISTPLQIEVLNEISTWLKFQTNRTTFRGGQNQKRFVSDFQY